MLTPKRALELARQKMPKPFANSPIKKLQPPVPKIISKIPALSKVTLKPKPPIFSEEKNPEREINRVTKPQMILRPKPIPDRMERIPTRPTDLKIVAPILANPFLNPNVLTVDSLANSTISQATLANSSGSSFGGFQNIEDPLETPITTPETDDKSKSKPNYKLIIIGVAIVVVVAVVLFKVFRRAK